MQKEMSSLNSELGIHRKEFQEKCDCLNNYIEYENKELEHLKDEKKEAILELKS